MSFKDTLERNIVWWSLLMLATGFGAGIYAYSKNLEMTNQTPVIKDSFYTKEEVSRDWIRKSDCKGTSDGVVQRLDSPAASEIEHRANETLKFLQTVEDDLTRERYDARWILTVTVALLNGDNKEFSTAKPNLLPEFQGKRFQNLLDALRASHKSGSAGVDATQASFNRLRDVLLPASPEEYTKDNVATRQAIIDARKQLNAIKDGLGH